MRLLVRPKSVLAGEVFAARAAHIGPHPQMHVQVLFQQILAAVLFAAVLTRPGFRLRQVHPETHAIKTLAQKWHSVHLLWILNRRKLLKIL